jgi:FADH2 O2-dependent halogenase
VIELDADLAIVGSGFGGSICAQIGRRLGLRVVLIERGAHPRFALGESSTPAADLSLQTLARRYDLPRLLPLARYGAWKRKYPSVMRGLKRGFSYFHHVAGKPFTPRADHSNELLVAANPDAERGDTHWLRADVDAFLVGEAAAAGVRYVDRTALDVAEHEPRWLLSGRREDEEVRIGADFLIDASGDGGFLARALSIPGDVARLHTHSRCVYSHFRGVRHWGEVLAGRGGNLGEHPFPCDEAALHHVFDGGWIYVLRFDDGIVSAGFSLDPRRFPLDETLSPADEWASMLRRFPSIAEQFHDAEPVMPFKRTGRLQRLASLAAGPNWAMLPTAAGFIDALHSTGNAHTLSGIERLMAILAETSCGAERSERLQAYSDAIRAEVRLIDWIVDGCYRAFDCFEAMTAYAMHYFAAATCSEQMRRERPGDVARGFLLNHDTAFVDCVHRAHVRVSTLSRQRAWTPADVRAFEEEVAASLSPYNLAGLCDPARKNMYPYAGP